MHSDSLIEPAPSTSTVVPAPYDAMLADHGFDPVVSQGLTYPLGDYEPAFGEFFELMPGVHWTRTPVPGPLGHINNWILPDVHPDGTPGFAIVDTGLFMPATIAVWKSLFESGALAGQNATKIIVTHYHPDHVGCAGWLAKRFKAPVYMNRTEWLMTRMLIADKREGVPTEALDEWRFCGWEQRLIDDFAEKGWGRFARAVSDLPIGHIGLKEGTRVRTGTHEWRIMIGNGHTPEHACLIDDTARVMISGDQILPRITSNISTLISEPAGDPLGDWLASIARFRRELPNDLLVLPAHGRPFQGAHERLDALAARHHEALDGLVEGLRAKEMRVVDSFPFLFARPITDDVIGMASGEAMATLRHLEYSGRVARAMREGVAWYRAA